METNYTCPNCGREYMKKDTAKFCKFCGHKIVEQPPQSRPVPPAAPASSQNGVGNAPYPAAPVPQRPQNIPPRRPKQPKKKGGMVAAIVAGIVLLLLVAVGTVIFMNKLGFLNLDFLKLNGTGGSAGGESVAEETADGAGTEAAEGEAVDEEAGQELLQEAEALFEENKEKVLDDQLRSEALAELQDSIALYQEAGANEALKAEALAGMRDVVSYYEKGIQSQVDMLMAQEVSADIYQEIVKNLDDALTYGQSLVDAGYDVSMNGITDLRSNIEDKYKALYIEKYNGFIEEYNWNVRANEEFARGAYEVFPSDDPDDPIRLRYAYAKAWLVHQEIVEGMADGSLDADGAVEKIMASLEETDYCEFLMEEAENYALNSSKPNIDYFTSLKRSSILSDSSSREYTVEEIEALGLSAAELRYARIEIYARHGMNCWDTSVSNTLGSSGQVDMYKFMSYNDFGIYSTDNTNGLTATERHNIRVIGQMEKDFIGSGYFMIK